MEKKNHHHIPKFTKHWTFLTIELSQYCKSTFSLSKPIAASSNCSLVGNAPCLFLPVKPAQAVPEHYPKSSFIDTQSKPLIVSWNSLQVIFGSLADAQIEARGELFSTLIPQTATAPTNTFVTATAAAAAANQPTSSKHLQYTPTVDRSFESANLALITISAIGQQTKIN